MAYGMGPGPGPIWPYALFAVLRVLRVALSRLLCVVCESTLLGRLGLDLGAPPLEAAVGLGVGLALLTCLVGLDRKRVAMAFILN